MPWKCASRWLFEDNLVYGEPKSKITFASSLISATRMMRGVKEEGYLYLDDAGMLWVDLARDADTDVRAWFPTVQPELGPVPAAAIGRAVDKLLPARVVVRPCGRP